MNIEHPKHIHLRGQRFTERGRTAFYVLAYDNGRPMLMGGYASRSLAESIATTKCHGPYEVLELLADMEEATRQIREKGIVDQGFDSNSFRRFKHK